MERIASFCVDHDKLERGIYISRIDGDITTYDLRFCKPNTPPFLENAAMHTIEHLFATMARNSEVQDNVIYFGPMGCRTGFYLLMRNLPDERTLELIKDVVKRISEYEGEIPGTTSVECGNYLEHDLDGAKKAAADYFEVIKDWKCEQLDYNFGK